MYNEEIKKRFLKEYKNAKIGGIRTAFENFSKYEKLHNLDLAELDRKGAVEAIESIKPEETRTVSGFITALRNYTEFCEDNKLFSNIPRGFFAITIDDIDLSKSLASVLFKDESELIDSIRLVHGFESGFVDVPVLALTWLGLSKDEIIALRDNDVNLEDRIITGGDGSILAMGFSDQIAEVLFLYRKCQISERGKDYTSMVVRKDNSVNSFLKKMLPENSKKFGKEFTKVQIDAHVNSLATKYEQLGHPRRHSISNVWRSGRLRQLYIIEQQNGIDVTAKENKELLRDVFRNKKNYYDAIRMYKWYKKAFCLE